MAVIGFTGTRNGMTDRQKRTVRSILEEIGPRWGHHGDCIGADNDFDEICEDLDILRHAWPGHDKDGRQKSRAHCRSEIIEEPRPYLIRDRIIVVQGVDGLIATPKGRKEELRSGTWTTVRMARNLGRKRWVVFPDGTISDRER